MKRVKCPWDFPEELREGDAGVVRTRPTPEGKELGDNLRRLIGGGDFTDCCEDCAFREGSVPSQTPETQMVLLKCLMEGEPFYCHHEDKPPCRAYLEARRRIAASEKQINTGPK